MQSAQRGNIGLLQYLDGQNLLSWVSLEDGARSFTARDCFAEVLYIKLGRSRMECDKLWKQISRVK